MQELKFPVAAHTYFSIQNLDEQRERFLVDDAAANPVFRYGASYRIEVVAERIKQLQVSDQAKRAKYLELVALSIALQNCSDLDHGAVTDFRVKNAALYTEPTANITRAILQRVSSLVGDDTQHLWDEVCAMLPVDLSCGAYSWPTSELFTTLRGYAREYMRELRKIPFSTPLVELLQQSMQLTGLNEEGWRLKTRDDGSHAHVVHKTRSVIVGSFYQPRTLRAARRIAAHEIYGHAIRGYQQSEREAEGFAILLEQLMDKSFKPRRMYRYLAASLGWGAIADPKDFRQTFEVLWRVMVIASKYSRETARRHAFDECSRVFRGGRPDLPGAVFLKDTVYFESNMAFWRALSERSISYNEFMKIAEGKQKVLS